MQQSLTTEAANVVKQAVALARRRGHAQVTPLHVANTMLSAPNGLLRTACLQSHSHPLQCKALELCFNVALNRLPASSTSPMLGHHSQQYPTISNALVAAFKRAQAHQRRGSIENQQQPLLAVKIELEQLIISILDDPSVSRVMREAGFSSSQVKNNVEQAVSLELSPSATRNKSKENSLLVLSQPSKPSENYAEKLANKPSSADPIKDEDVISVIESLMNGSSRKRSIVVVGECLANIDGVVRGVMDKVDKGDVPEELKEVKFISVPLFSFGHLHREEVEQKMGELTCLVRRFVAKGVVLYLGDLKWITDFRRCEEGSKQGMIRNYYCPVEHMIIEFGRLLSVFGSENGKFWLMGIATYQTYMRCRSGHQYSLEALWSLHPITLPAANLGLSLSTDQSESRRQIIGNGCNDHRREEEAGGELNCCADCSAKFEAEARNLQTAGSISNSESTLSSSLPSWLKEESKRLIKDNDQNCLPIRELCKKWNSFCSSSFHRQTKSMETIRTSTFSSSTSPSSSTSFFSYDQQQLHEPKKSCSSDLMFWSPATAGVYDKTCDINEQLMREPKQVIVSPLSTSTPNSAASSSDINMEMEYIPSFKEFNSENLNILCNALEKKVPWQREVIPDIAGTILQCRSGMLRRKEKLRGGEVKEETWLFFQGLDVQAKEEIARELAKVVFGSYSNFVSIALSSFSSTRADSDSTDQDMMKNKRSRDEQSSSSYIERLSQAISENPHRVFLVEDVEQADLCSQVGIKRAIQRGKMFNNSSGEEVNLSDAIIILSCESFSSRSRACSPPPLKQSLEEDQENSPCVSLDLNISFDDDDDDDDVSIDDVGILENVDRRIVFKMRDDIQL